MSQSQGMPWSNNPYAPQISQFVYFEEKATFAGVIISTILYGIVIALFFQCMGSLLDSVSRAKGVKWGLVIHTGAMFSIVTVYTAIVLSTQSDSYINNREFPGIDGVLPPGPLGYQYLTARAISVVRTATFLLNNWLADALLLYRCYVIYSMNYRVIIFPCLMYLASLAMGIAYIYRSSRPVDVTTLLAAINRFGIPHHSISVSLNVLLTVMIVVRLMLHRREVQKAMGAQAADIGLYKVVITMLVESCALFAVAFLLFVGAWAAGSPLAAVFFLILVQAQVISPFLVILRVANQSASKRNTTVSQNPSSVHFQTQGKSVGSGGTLVNGYPMNSTSM